MPHRVSSRLVASPRVSSRLVVSLRVSSLRLCDFGFACFEKREEPLYKEFCTPQYAAPEIASPTDAHRGYRGHAVDMWALGCVVYEMLHRRPAFKAEALFELQVRVCMKSLSLFMPLRAYRCLSVLSVPLLSVLVGVSRCLCVSLRLSRSRSTPHIQLQGLIRNCNFTPFNKHIRVPPDAKALIRGLLTQEHKRLTADQVLRESPWVSEEAAAARAAEKELEKERAAAAEAEAKRRASTGAFGL